MNALGVTSIRRQIRALFDFAFDAVLPPRERTARTKARKLEDIPLQPTSHRLLGVDIATVLNYREQSAQDLIRALKYDGSGAAASLAASVLADYLYEDIANAKQFSPREVLLVPIPLHRSRRRDRGFNQIEIVLKALPNEFRDGTLSRFTPEALIRSRATKQQTRLHRSERIANMKDAFAVIDPTRVERSHIYLIDDVATTGATLKSAGASLSACGATVTLLALARA